MAQYPELEMPPKVWHHHITREQQVTADHLRKRLIKLQKAGLVETVDGTSGYYRITDLGKSYVNDELSRADMEELNPNE